MRRTLAAVILIVCLASCLEAQNRPEFQVIRAIEPPKIDGILNDAVWTQDPLPLDGWISYNPLRGGHADQRTDVRIAYDDRYIYFGFHCFDTEPDKIRTTISRRDNVFNDDWVALSLDSAGTGQTAYHLFVNPSGIQMDALNTSASGEQFEADLLWDSAGKILDDGYGVEIRLPLQTIRFSSGAEVRMGLVFFRKISRTGISYSWPEMPPGQWVFENHARFLFQDLHQPMLLELLPSVTYGISQTRAPTQQWNPAIDRFEVGLSAKYGITSNITLDATINPDFSQVESDAFQVQVNQRFPIFYSEKRPFFMEGMGLFNLAGTGGDGNMRTAVHTRRIINPLWGSKLTGTAGKLTFGLLNASDETPEDIGGRGEVITGRKKLFTIGRATYSLGKSDYVGVILTDAEHAGRSNRVGGGDLSIKLSPRQQLSTTFLFSHTGVSFSDSHQSVGAQVSYSYNTRRFTWSNQIEHYGREFQMDTAFYNRVGFTSGWSFGEINFYPKPDSKFWLKRVHPFYWAKRGYDSIQNGTDEFLHTGIRFNFTRQGFFNLSHSRGHEPWMGQSFKTGALVNLFGSTQIFRWLSIEGSFRNTNSIYYDRVSPFQGKARSGSFGFSLQPNQHLQQNVDYDGISFRRASTGEQIYTVHIINTQTTYQFNKHFRLRLLEQFDSSQRRLLTDFLAMYELVPGTVFHAGYGSLNERQSTFDGRYLTVTRGLFFKASYRHRF